MKLIHVISLILCVFTCSICPAADDPRDIRNGSLIPDEGYCDQPYVVETKDGNWLCILTTGPGTESQKHQHIVATISSDHGKTWSEPIDIEPGESPDWRMTSWAVALVTPSGRVYVFYNYDGDKVRKRPNGKKARECILGWYCYKYSDDNGRTWSKQRYRLPLRVTDVDRNNDWHGAVQMFWGIDKPIVTSGGKDVLLVFSKIGRYMQDEGEGWLFRSDNILTEPDPEKIRWEMLPDGEKGIRNPAFGSVQEEHNIVELNNGNILCAYRTTMGFPAVSLSKNGGRSWSMPEPMTYSPGGRALKHNRACPMLWKTSTGRYLFWFHNNATKDYPGRNPVWITGGTEKDGAIHWAEPEILLYDRKTDILGISYPDLIEKYGRFWVTETQKTVARVHRIDASLLEGLWRQSEEKTVAREGLLLEWRDGETDSRQPEISGHVDFSGCYEAPLSLNEAGTGDESGSNGKEYVRSSSLLSPHPSPLQKGEGTKRQQSGLTLDCWIEPVDLSPGQTILDTRRDGGKGVALTTAENGAVRFTLYDGENTVAYQSDQGMLRPGKLHHLVAIADAGPKIITFVVDGRLCDGGEQHIQGWHRWTPDLGTVLESGPIHVNPAIKSLRIYDRYLRTSEAVANYNAGEKRPMLDPRNIRNGDLIPDEDYCDQPYIVVTKDDNWLCTMTTGPANEGARGQHVVSAISKDKGKTWSKPVDIEPSLGPEASWVVPLVTPGGRVYAFYNYNGDRIQSVPGDPTAKRFDMFGWYCYKYSDDNGRSWSKEHYRLPMRVTACDRTNNWKGKEQIFWGIDKPKIANGYAFFAFTKLGRYMLDDGEGWMFRSDNILTEPDPKKISWTLLPDGEHGIRAPKLGSVQEEHNIVPLGGDKLYCVYRTTNGFPCHSYSDDGGRTWTEPVPMTYSPGGGRIIKNPRACPKLWRTSNGNYLFWYHNHSVGSFTRRNPAWLSGGVLKDGRIHWSQPEIVLYDPIRSTRTSYPDLVEQDGRYWISETQKTEARVHEIDGKLLEGLWRQGIDKTVSREGIMLEWSAGKNGGNEIVVPKTVNLSEAGGLSIDCWITLDDMKPGQIILDTRDSAGVGIALTTTKQGTVRLDMSDGKNSIAWDCGRDLLTPGKPHHLVAIADAGPKLVNFVVDGQLCDGGRYHWKGWQWWKGDLGSVLNRGPLRAGPALKSLRVYDRYLRTSEAIANYNAGMD